MLDLLAQYSPCFFFFRPPFIATVFAPTDAAFEGVAIADEQEVILDILLFHVVPEVALNSDMLVCTETTEMANMEDSRHVCEKDEEGFTVRYQKGARQHATNCASGCGSLRWIHHSRRQPSHVAVKLNVKTRDTGSDSLKAR